MALRLADLCPPDDNAYSVGCVLVDRRTNTLVATGYSREDDNRCHAEQSAIRKVVEAAGIAEDDPNVSTLFEHIDMYTTMEPCSKRDSHPEPCTALTLRHGIKQVFMAVMEPPNFKNCTGAQTLRQHGVQITHMRRFTSRALAPNAHIVTAAPPQKHRCG